MTVKEALNLIDNALALITTNREGHAVLQEAVATVTKALDEKKPKE